MKALALVCFLALLTLPAQGAAPLMRYPQAVLTDLGGPKFIAENDQDAVVSGVQVFVSAGLQRQSSDAAGMAAFLAELIARSGNVRDVVEAMGGTLTYTVEGRTVHYYLEARHEKIASVLSFFAQALGKPDFSASHISAARKALIARVGESEGNPLAVGIAMFKGSYYLNGAGSPVIGSVASLERISKADVAKFYADTYMRGSLSFSASGRITPELTAALRQVASMLPQGELKPLSGAVKALSRNNETRIVAQRDVAAPFLVVGFPAPPPADRDFGAMLLLESLLANSFDRSTTTQSLAERTISAFYLYDSTPASFVVFVNGARIEPTLALREVLLLAQSLADKPMEADSLKKFKAMATGSFLSSTLTLADRSYLIGTLQQEGVGEDPLNNALTALQQTSSTDVQRVAKRYLQKYIVAIVLPRRAQEP